MIQSKWQRILLFSCILVCVLIEGCGSIAQKHRQPSFLLEADPARESACIIYLMRVERFAGQGREHILKLDGRPLGRLTGSNYYRLVLWPGRYVFGVQMPEESFLGQTRPALGRTKRIDLQTADAGRSFLLRYTDGMMNDGFAFFALEDRSSAIEGRTLAAAVELKATAQVSEWFKARYTGPARDGRPHGWGTLAWEDGSSYRGRFDHGHPSTHGHFFYSDGRFFRGALQEGRPYRSGLLFSPDGRLIFAGPFLEEKPHGDGLRIGKKGPERCRFENGVDVTPGVDALARKASMDLSIDADVARQQIIDQQEAMIDLNRQWCRQSFRQGFRYCLCAPFAEDYFQWPDCISE